MLQWTTACCKRRAAIRRKWILCSSEQSKLCLCPTESLLTDKNQPASLTVEGFPHGRRLSSKVGKAYGESKTTKKIKQKTCWRN